MNDGAQEAEDKRVEWEKKLSQIKNKREKTNLKNKIKMLQDIIDEAEKNEEKKWKKYFYNNI